MKKILVLATSLVLSASSLPALANGFSVSIASPNGLSAPEATVSVAVSGIPQDQGIYLMLCEGEGATPRPANCSSAHQAWLTTAASSLRMGAVAALPVNEFKVASTFSTRAGVAVDCTTSKCGVFVRRDHFGSADVSLDRFIPISFAAPKQPQAAIIGSFANKVAIRLIGAAESQVVVKLGGRWITLTPTSNNQLFNFSTKAKSVSVRVFVDKEELANKRVSIG